METFFQVVGMGALLGGAIFAIYRTVVWFDEYSDTKHQTEMLLKWAREHDKDWWYLR